MFIFLTKSFLVAINTDINVMVGVLKGNGSYKHKLTELLMHTFTG